jgi:hypothetical protein
VSISPKISLVVTVALGVAGCGGGAGPGNGTAARGASLGGFGPAVTTPVADVTANVFVLELSLPEGLSRADAEAADTRALQREAAELALKITETKIGMGLVEKTRWSRRTMTFTEEGFQGLARRGVRVVPGTEIRRSTTRGAGPHGQPVETHSYTVTVESPAGRHEVAGRPSAEAEKFWATALEAQRTALAALPPPEGVRPRRLEVRERWRYVTVFPPVPQLEEGGFHTETRNRQGCRACAEQAHQRHALYLSSFGAPGVDPATLATGALDAGIELEGRDIVFGGADEADRIRVERTSAGRLTLRRVASCPARVVRVEDTLVIHHGSGIIAVPHREAQMWHELRDAACVVKDGPVHEAFGPSPPLPPDAAKKSARFWIEQHRAELARLKRGEFAQTLP